MGPPSLESGKHKDRFPNPLPQEVSRKPVWELQGCFAWIYVCKTVAFNSFSYRRSLQGYAERGIRISSLFHLDTVIMPIGTLNVLKTHNKRAVLTVLEWLNWTCMTLFETILISILGRVQNVMDAQGGHIEDWYISGRFGSKCNPHWNRLFFLYIWQNYWKSKVWYSKTRTSKM